MNFLNICSSIENVSIVETGKKEKIISGEKLNKIIKGCYDKAAEIENIIIQSNNFFTFTKVFKYFGSWISYNLYDEYDILQRIKKANQAMGALNFIWKAHSVDQHAKYQIFMKVPLNIFLRGCGSWFITKNFKKIEVFQMRCLRRIIRIK